MELGSYVTYGDSVTVLAGMENIYSSLAIHTNFNKDNFMPRTWVLALVDMETIAAKTPLIALTHACAQWCYLTCVAS